MDAIGRTRTPCFPYPEAKGGVTKAVAASYDARRPQKQKLAEKPQHPCFAHLV